MNSDIKYSFTMALVWSGIAAILVIVHHITDIQFLLNLGLGFAVVGLFRAIVGAVQTYKYTHNM